MNPIKLYIPSIGFKLQLTKDWSPTLHNEDRNLKFATNMGVEIKEIRNNWGYKDEGFENTTITVPKDTVLKVSRIYIRVGNKGFDSITFTIVQSPNKKCKGRFWVKRTDANEIEFEPWTDFSEL